MSHVETERLHRYLAGALAPAERDLLEAHLADCSACSMALAELAAEESFLTDALAFDTAERAWIDSVDLVEPVMAQVAPRFRMTPVTALISLLILLAGYVAGSVWSLGAGRLYALTHPGSLVDLLHDLLPGLAQLVPWLLNGGLLPTIWPILAIGSLAGLWRLIRMKETNDYA